MLKNRPSIKATFVQRLVLLGISLICRYRVTVHVGPVNWESDPCMGHCALNNESGLRYSEQVMSQRL